MNDSIYNYFKAAYGTVTTTQTKSFNQIQGVFHQIIEKASETAKMLTAPASEIRYVSRLLRTKLSNKSSISSPSSSIHYDNFWGFVKNIIAKPSKVLPSFSREVCIKHLIRMFLSALPTHQFTIPSWIP